MKPVTGQIARELAIAATAAWAAGQAMRAYGLLDRIERWIRAHGGARAWSPS